jgi:NADH-quinone oxidoreductase subunit C
MSGLTHEQVQSRLEERFQGIELERQTGDAVRDFTLYVPAERLVDVCTFLRDDPGLDFAMLSWVGGVDLLPRDPRFEVVYSLLSLTHRLRLHLKVRACRR